MQVSVVLKPDAVALASFFRWKESKFLQGAI
jgi:hypothetical protein